MQRFFALLLFSLALSANFVRAQLADPYPVRVYLTNFHGLECFQVRTPVGQYIFDVHGGGLAGLIDRDGKDWISWNPTNGPKGSLRGIPNAGVAFHPGFTNAVTQEPHVMPTGATLVSQSFETGMKAYWFFSTTNVQVIFMKATNHYMFAYAGTPAGKFDTNSNFQLTPHLGRQSVTNQWHSDLPNLEWVAYGDSKSPRSLVLLNHTDDESGDFSLAMDGAMQSFAFGGQYPSGEPALTKAPARFSFGLVESTEASVLQYVADKWSKARPANW